MPNTGLKFLCFLFVFFRGSLWAQTALPLVTPPYYLVEWNNTITEAMITDGFSPLLASRSYVYPNIAAYEALRFEKKASPSVAGQLNELDSLPLPEPGKPYYFDVSAITAFKITGKEMVYREFVCDTLYNRQIAFIRQNNRIDEGAFQNSVRYGELLARAIIKWAKKDKYNKIKAQPKYIISSDEGKWIPTPPEYKSPLEPFWYILRPCAIASPDAFVKTYPLTFDSTKGSPFFNLAKEVYETGVTLSQEQRKIAQYWDCNPDQTTYLGHNMLPRRQMSPTAHWIGVIAYVLKQQKQDARHQAIAFVYGSIAVYDAYICCWKQKFTTEVIRPVTYIRNWIDSSWEPLLVTPNFPEYVSGHSTISAATAGVLTYLFGENFTFTDSCVAEYNLQPATFSSFKDAAAQASISRLYGGIHYRNGLDEGQAMGYKVADAILKRLKLNAPGEN